MYYYFHLNYQPAGCSAQADYSVDYTVGVDNLVVTVVDNSSVVADYYNKAAVEDMMDIADMAVDNMVADSTAVVDKQVAVDNMAVVAEDWRTCSLFSFFPLA